jgi:glycosyltransferase involved in cell wall biosynthesis
MRFSVLISIYSKEVPAYFHRAMLSIWDEQTIKPSQIILVQDGALTNELYETIDVWKKKLGNILEIVVLEKNVGLGSALSQGLSKCCYDLVARMDTDDIAHRNRFEKQLECFQRLDIDICGTLVSEFEGDETNIVSHRKVPQTHSEIISFGKKRNPLNHPTVMYKKSIIERVGNYKTLLWLEDYYLWVRAIMDGASVYNIQEPLVYMRIGYEQLKRRAGLKYAISEAMLQVKFWKLGYINTFEFIRNIMLRTFIRVVPKFFLKKVYQRLRA